jgi:hypothetical protein
MKLTIHFPGVKELKKGIFDSSDSFSQSLPITFLLSNFHLHIPHLTHALSGETIETAQFHATRALYATSKYMNGVPKRGSI